MDPLLPTNMHDVSMHRDIMHIHDVTLTRITHVCTQALRKVWQQDPSHGSWQPVNHLTLSLRALSNAPQNSKTPALLWWQWRARTCPPSSLSPKSHYTCTHFTQQLTQVTHRLRCVIFQSTGHSVGKNCPRGAATEIGFPLGLKGQKLVPRGREERKGAEEHPHAVDLIPKGFPGTWVNFLFKYIILSTKNSSDFFLTGNSHPSYEIFETWSGGWHFSSELSSQINAVSLTVNLAQCLNLSSVLVSLSKICKQMRIRKSLLVREVCVQAGTGQARKQARGLSHSQTPPCTGPGWPGRSAGASLHSRSCYKRGLWYHSAFDSTGFILLFTLTRRPNRSPFPSLTLSTSVTSWFLPPLRPHPSPGCLFFQKELLFLWSPLTQVPSRKGHYPPQPE